mmetsp:Transcript_25999/g.66151  ORF Transcript_25999/g.66151 Transcript_25999/m.66151 type:complete len:280 (+) Transcript_25999:1987-2826(+)
MASSCPWTQRLAGPTQLRRALLRTATGRLWRASSPPVTCMAPHPTRRLQATEPRCATSFGRSTTGRAMTTQTARRALARRARARAPTPCPAPASARAQASGWSTWRTCTHQRMAGGGEARTPATLGVALRRWEEAARPAPAQHPAAPAMRWLLRRQPPSQRAATRPTATPRCRPSGPGGEQGSQQGRGTGGRRQMSWGMQRGPATFILICRALHTVRQQRRHQRSGRTSARQTTATALHPPSLLPLQHGGAAPWTRYQQPQREQGGRLHLLHRHLSTSG